MSQHDNEILKHNADVIDRTRAAIARSKGLRQQLTEQREIAKQVTITWSEGFRSS